MKISALQEYGLRCLVQLARDAPEPSAEQTLSTREVAEREGLTVEYTAQILASLRRVGLVKSVRGVHGGFRLAFPAREITIGRLFRALDGPIAEDLCDSYTGNRETCTHAGACSIAPVWAELARRIYGFLDSISLADLATGAIPPQQPTIIPLDSLRRR